MSDDNHCKDYTNDPKSLCIDPDSEIPHIDVCKAFTNLPASCPGGCNLLHIPFCAAHITPPGYCKTPGCKSPHVDMCFKFKRGFECESTCPLAHNQAYIDRGIDIASKVNTNSLSSMVRYIADDLHPPEKYLPKSRALNKRCMTDHDKQSTFVDPPFINNITSPTNNIACDRLRQLAIVPHLDFTEIFASMANNEPLIKKE